MSDMPAAGDGSREGISRRGFLRGGAGVLASASLLNRGMQAGVPEVVEGDRPVLHLIGHSHIDAAWLWPWKDSADLVLTTFRSALDRGDAGVLL